MATLTAGGNSSATLVLDAFASVTVVADGSCNGTLSFVSDAQNLLSNKVAKVQNKTYGPYGVPGTVTISITAGSLTYTVNGNTGGFEYDADGNIVGLVGLNSTKPVFKPWKIACYGDSRCNTGSTGPDVTGSATQLTTLREPAWVAAYMLDAEIAYNYGVSADTAALWADDSRSGGKTFTSMGTSDAEVVYIQYGVNDCIASTAAATTAANLQALCTAAMKAGKYVLMCSILPVNSGQGGSFATVQALIESVNALMQAWCAYFPLKCLYIDTASPVKSGSYASTTYFNADGVHMNRRGAQLVGRTVAAACRTLLPVRAGLFPGPDTLAPNLLNLASPSSFAAAESGTTGGVTITSGQDSDGWYTQYWWTPATLGSSICRVRCELNVNFQNTVDPYFALTGNEILQGSARIKLDNGTDGGTPVAYLADIRQRFYTGSIFNAVGLITTTQDADWPDFAEALDYRFITPRLVNATASASAAPSVGTGYSLQVFVSASSTGNPLRLRVYNAQLRRVGYSSVPVAVTPPASTVAYTNSTQGNQEIFISAGTVTVIAVNGVTTGLTSGMFVLNPADTLTITYSSVPTMIVKQF